MKSWIPGWRALAFLLLFVTAGPAVFSQDESSLFDSAEVRVGIRPVQDAAFRPGDSLQHENDGSFGVDNQDLTPRLELVFTTASELEIMLNVNHGELIYVDDDYDVTVHVMGSEIGLARKIGIEYVGIEPVAGLGVSVISSEVNYDDAGTIRTRFHSGIGASASLGVNVYGSFGGFSVYPGVKYVLVGNSDVSLHYVPVTLSVGYEF